MVWKSKLVPSMVLVENPREWDLHIETAQVWFNARAAANGTRPIDLEAAHPLRVEREILKSWEQTTVLGGERLELRQVLGTAYAQHFIRYLSLLVESLDPDPWFQEKVWSFFDTRKRGKQITNWFGSQSSGKTTAMAVMSNGFALLEPAHTRQTVSGPFKKAGESPLWNEVEAVFEEIKLKWGSKLSEWTGAQWNSRKKRWESNPELTSVIMESSVSTGVLTFCAMPKAGTITLVAMDKVGKVQGAKAKDRNQRKGFVCFWLDEIGAGYPSLDILRALKNLKSNRNFHMVTACNPFNPVGQLDGELGRPEGGFESLKIEEDFVWDSAEDSRTYRFDGHFSPNILLGETRWPWLFDQRNREVLLKSCPVDSDYYNSQCRAFMNGGSGSRYVLNSHDIRIGAVDSQFEFTHHPIVKVAFVDPALSTDGDNAVYTELHIGWMKAAHGGDDSLHPVCWCPEQRTIPVFTGRRADADDVRRCQAVRGASSPGNWVVGQVMPVEEQVAIQTGWSLVQSGIDQTMCGYDDSMRGRVVLAFQWAMGDRPLLVSSVGEPEETPIYPPQFFTDEKGRRQPVTWRDDCQKFVSQMWFFGAAVVRSGVFRCSPGVHKALLQATRRFWSYAAGGRKRFVESKKDYKTRNSNNSPDEGDSLMGAFHVAQKRGVLRLKVETPKEHLSAAGVRKVSPILRQWRDRRIATGLRMTGTRN